MRSDAFTRALGLRYVSNKSVNLVYIGRFSDPFHYVPRYLRPAAFNIHHTGCTYPVIPYSHATSSQQLYLGRTKYSSKKKKVVESSPSLLRTSYFVRRLSDVYMVKYRNSSLVDRSDLLRRFLDT